MHESSSPSATRPSPTEDSGDEDGPTRVQPAVDPLPPPFVATKTVMGLGLADAPVAGVVVPPRDIRLDYKPLAWDDDEDALTQVRPAPDDDIARTQVMAAQPAWTAELGAGIGPWSGGQPQRFPIPESNPPPPMTMPTVAPGPGRRSRAGIVVLAALTVACAGVGAMLLRPHKGQLAIDLAVEGGETAPPLTEIFVDGHKVCAGLPCVVDGVTAGPRIVQVVAPGFIAPEAGAEQVEAGKQNSVVIPLRPSPASTGFRASGNQPGVKVYVDGVDQGPLPARVVELAPGTHRLRFSGGERFQAQERSVDVLGGQIQDIGEIRLKVVLGRITVDNATPGARVVIVRDGARKAMHGPWPMTLDVDATQGWKLTASARGRKDLVQPLNFADGQPVRTIRIDLPPR